LTDRPYFRSLDGLRCLAILPIVWHHSTTGSIDGLRGRGPLGVDLFFALSGFLITTLLLHERGASPSGAPPLDLARFWTRRCLRIFPLYYVVLAAFVVHALFVRDHGPVRDYFLQSVPFYATYTSNWFLHGAVDHPIVFAFAWSLAAEEQFYLLWPVVLRFCRGIGVPALVMAALVALDQAAERGFLAAFVGDGLALRMIRSFATPIGLGSLLALAVYHSTTSRAVSFVLAQRGSSIVALACVAVAVAQPWSIFPTHLALTALVGACALRRDHFLGPILEHPVVRHVGVVSYGIYLLNVSVVSATRRLLPDGASTVFVFLAATVLSVGAASLTYRWVERPFLRWRERLRVFDGHEDAPSYARNAQA
jgi:peptidoglycan/LPS O-acetylase OafA/YrhL